MYDDLFLLVQTFLPPLLFADAVFPWFVYVNITVEIVTLDTL
jgi:hypothetical protein